VHPNNCCPVATIDGIGVPEVIEVTFIRNDLLPKYSNNSRVYLPHRLDRKNVERNTDILMPRIWWDTRI